MDSLKDFQRLWDFQAFAESVSTAAENLVARDDGKSFFNYTTAKRTPTPKPNAISELQIKQLSVLLSGLQAAVSGLVKACYTGPVRARRVLSESPWEHNDLGAHVEELCTCLERCLFFGSTKDEARLWQVLLAATLTSRQRAASKEEGKSGAEDGTTILSSASKLASIASSTTDVQSQVPPAPLTRSNVGSLDEKRRSSAVEEVRGLEHVHTDHGRCRAWVRALLHYKVDEIGEQLSAARSALITMTAEKDAEGAKGAVNVPVGEGGGDGEGAIEGNGKTGAAELQPRALVGGEGGGGEGTEEKKIKGVQGSFGDSDGSGGACGSDRGMPQAYIVSDIAAVVPEDDGCGKKRDGVTGGSSKTGSESECSGKESVVVTAVNLTTVLMEKGGIEMSGESNTDGAKLILNENTRGAVSDVTRDGAVGRDEEGRPVDGLHAQVSRLRNVGADEGDRDGDLNSSLPVWVKDDGAAMRGIMTCLGALRRFERRTDKRRNSRANVSSVSRKRAGPEVRPQTGKGRGVEVEVTFRMRLDNPSFDKCDVSPGVTFSWPGFEKERFQISVEQAGLTDANGLYSYDMGSLAFEDVNTGERRGSKSKVDSAKMNNHNSSERESKGAVEVVPSEGEDEVCNRGRETPASEGGISEKTEGRPEQRHTLTRTARSYPGIMVNAGGPVPVTPPVCFRSPSGFELVRGYLILTAAGGDFNNSDGINKNDSARGEANGQEGDDNEQAGGPICESSTLIDLKRDTTDVNGAAEALSTAKASKAVNATQNVMMCGMYWLLLRSEENCTAARQSKEKAQMGLTGAKLDRGGKKKGEIAEQDDDVTSLPLPAAHKHGGSVNVVVADGSRCSVMSEEGCDGALKGEVCYYSACSASLPPSQGWCAISAELLPAPILEFAVSARDVVTDTAVKAPQASLVEAPLPSSAVCASVDAASAFKPAVVMYPHSDHEGQIDVTDEMRDNVRVGVTEAGGGSTVADDVLRGMTAVERQTIPTLPGMSSGSEHERCASVSVVAVSDDNGEGSGMETISDLPNTRSGSQSAGTGSEVRQHRERRRVRRRPSGLLLGVSAASRDRWLEKKGSKEYDDQKNGWGNPPESVGCTSSTSSPAMTPMLELDTNFKTLWRERLINVDAAAVAAGGVKTPIGAGVLPDSVSSASSCPSLTPQYLKRDITGGSISATLEEREKQFMSRSWRIAPCSEEKLAALKDRQEKLKVLHEKAWKQRVAAMERTSREIQQLINAREEMLKEDSTGGVSGSNGGSGKYANSPTVQRILSEREARLGVKAMSATAQTGGEEAKGSLLERLVEAKTAKLIALRAESDHRGAEGSTGDDLLDLGSGHSGGGSSVVAVSEGNDDDGYESGSAAENSSGEEEDTLDEGTWSFKQHVMKRWPSYRVQQLLRRTSSADMAAIASLAAAGTAVAVGQGNTGSSSSSTPSLDSGTAMNMTMVPIEVSVIVAKVVGDREEDARVDYVVRVTFQDDEDEYRGDNASAEVMREKSGSARWRGRRRTRERKSSLTVDEEDDAIEQGGDKDLRTLHQFVQDAGRFRHRSRTIFKRLTSIVSLHAHLAVIENTASMAPPSRKGRKIAANGHDGSNGDSGSDSNNDNFKGGEEGEGISVLLPPFPDPFLLGNLEERAIQVHFDKLAPAFKGRNVLRAAQRTVDGYLSQVTAAIRKSAGLDGGNDVDREGGGQDEETSRAGELCDALSNFVDICDMQGQQRKEKDLLVSWQMRDILQHVRTLDVTARPANEEKAASPKKLPMPGGLGRLNRPGGANYPSAPPLSNWEDDDAQLALQQQQCMGCHRSIEAEFLGIKKDYRPCRFLDGLFCREHCHSDSHRVIPRRVVLHWDFQKHRVCDAAAKFLDDTRALPWICLSALNPFMFNNNKALTQVRSLRHQLSGARQLCLFPKRKRCKEGLATLKRRLGGRIHLAIDTELYSLEDLIGVKDGSLAALLSSAVENICTHVADSCPVCSAKGRRCALCCANGWFGEEDDLIFAFQTDTITQCGSCKSLFHKSCTEQWGASFSCPTCT